MADKNQQSLANGTPPQFLSANTTSVQTSLNSRSEMQIRPSLGTDHGSDFNKLTKQPISMVNGQVSTNVKLPNWTQQTGHILNNFGGSGDNFLHQQGFTTPMPQQSLQFQTTKSNVYSENMNQPPQNVYPPQSQGNSQTQLFSVASSAPFTQTSSNVLSNKQSLIKPSPVMANRANIQLPGIMQSAHVTGNTPQHQGFSQMSKVNATSQSSQYANIPPVSEPSASSQINQPVSESFMQSTLPPKSSLLKKPLPGTPSYSNIIPPPTSQALSPSPQHVQGSHPASLINRPLSNLSQSFLPPSPQYPLVQNNSQGIPQGFQPSLSGVSIPPKPPTSNLLSTNPRQQGQTYPNSKHGTPTFQNPIQATRDIGPLPMGGVPTPATVPRQQNSLTNRLPPPSSAYGVGKHPSINSLTQGMEKMSVTQQGFNKLWGTESIDLLQCRNILPPQKVTPPPIRLHQEFMDNVNCSPEIFCCTLNKIPETNSLLQKSRLPLGILIHPFRDLSHLAVIQCSSIVRCRACRTYINPFVYFVDNKRWKCNLCFRVNELPDEFQYDPVSKTYGDPSRRPEIRSSTIEFIAPSEYMLRPPQPAIYLFVLDVSRWGCDSGYLETLCSILLEELDNIPGDSRTQIGFILFDSTIHFFSIAENYNQAHEMIVTDIDDVFLPTPDSLLVNLNENRQLIKDLLHEIPRKYAESFDTESALGPALQAAYKLMSPTGGRITVFQSCIPNKGPGALSPREDPNQRSSRDVRHLGPQTDFYKRLSLDCSMQQISVDLFLVSSQYSDLATLGGISQFSGGCIYHFPLFRRINPEINERLARALRRYLTRKIGFEAVMRVRCSRGLSIHTFHGNFFVRSTDLLSLPNVNPDAGFGMQIAIEDSLFELQCVCFQAAVLYTSAKGERRIRVHTLCLPVSSNLGDILTAADQQAIVGLLGKMAVDRSLKSTLSDAREAFINVAIDILSAYKLVETSGGQNTILTPVNLSLIPLYILALLKSTAFRTGQSTRLDDRVYAMSQMKTLPLKELIQLIHPDLYHITHLDDETGVEFEDKLVSQPARLTLSSEHLDSRGAFLLDTPEVIYILVGKNINPEFLVNIFDVKDIRQINKDLVDLPELENDDNEKLRHFINFLQADKPWPAVLKIVTEPNALAPFLISDKSENAFSYYELLHHVKAQLK